MGPSPLEGGEDADSSGVLPEGPSRTELDRPSGRQACVEPRAEDPPCGLVVLRDPEANAPVGEVFGEDSRPVLDVVLPEAAEASSSFSRAHETH